MQMFFQEQTRWATDFDISS